MKCPHGSSLIGVGESNKYSWQTTQFPSRLPSWHVCFSKRERLMQELHFMQWKKSMPRPWKQQQAGSGPMPGKQVDTKAPDRSRSGGCRLCQAKVPCARPPVKGQLEGPQVPD